MSAGGLDNKTGAGLEKVEKVAKVEKILKVGPSKEILKILVGNWVAQWDQTYKTWFYYNINTGLSSLEVFTRYLLDILCRYQYMGEAQGTPTCPAQLSIRLASLIDL